MKDLKTLRQQCELVAKVAATNLAYIALIKVKQSHRKKDQVLTTHCIMQKSREQSIGLETIFTERKEQFWALLVYRGWVKEDLETILWNELLKELVIF